MRAKLTDLFGMATLPSLRLFGQTFGEITGVVMDPSGAVLVKPPLLGPIWKPV